MVKLVVMASISVGLATADQQLTIQAVPRTTSAVRPIRTVGSRADSDTTPAITAPVSGYVADTSRRGIRPILGFRVFSFIGNFLDFGEDVASIVSSPNQNYVVEVAAGGAASLWVEANGGLGQTAFPADVSATSYVVPSPLGFSVAVVSQDGVVRVFSSLPNNPVLVYAATFSDLGGTPTSLAVSDDGSMLLYAVRKGTFRSRVEEDAESLYAMRNGGAPQLVRSGGVNAISFAPNSVNAVATDGLASQIYLLPYSSGQYAPWLLADRSAGVSRPVAAQFSRDGRQVVVANSLSRTVQTFGVDGSSGSTTACGCVMNRLSRLIGNAVFQISAFDGSAVGIFDGDSEPGVAISIGLLPPEDAKAQSDGSAQSVVAAGKNLE